MFSDPARPSWAIDGRGWPNRTHSRFVRAGAMMWHVQEMGAGPRLLLLHGTGAATHSFRDLAPALARHFTVLCPDLPGHGFSDMPKGRVLSLPRMAQLTVELLSTVGFQPDVVVGHSAGAAILVAMTLQRQISPDVVISLNGALRQIRGAALFSPLARLLSLNPLVPLLFARRAMGTAATQRLLEGTGSHIDAHGIEFYARLFQKPAHVAATLGMMAHWDLDWLDRRWASLAVPLKLVTSAGDRAIAPADAVTLSRRLATAEVVPLRTGGHLVHEERPSEIADLIFRLAAGTLSRAAAEPVLNRLGAAS